MTNERFLKDAGDSDLFILKLPELCFVLIVNIFKLDLFMAKKKSVTDVTDVLV